MSTAGKDPLIVACRLWKKKSAQGKTYLVGRMGGLRVLVMAVREPGGEDDATHELIVAAAPASGKRRPGGATE